MCRFLLAVLILGAGVLRLAYLASDLAIDLSPDEAHYWDWSRHLDWSYYSKGPLIAWLIHLSWLLAEPFAMETTGQAMLAVRLPAVVCGSLLLLSMYVLTVQVFRSEKLALGVVIMALTTPILNAGSILMTIDAPFTCCWGWALVFGYEAVFRQARWAWFAAGVMVALGVLAKYTMVLWMPSLALFFLFTPGFRKYLFCRGFAALVLLGILGGVPILIWNIENEWITFSHMRGHAGLGNEALHLWRGPLMYLGSQAGMLMGYWFLVWACAMGRSLPWQESRTDLRYLWWMSAPTFLLFFAFSPKNGGGEANWPATAYLSGLVLGAGWLTYHLSHAQRWHRNVTRAWLILFGSLGLGMSAMLYLTAQVYPVLPPGEEGQWLKRIDPSVRCQGWARLAGEVDRMRRQLAAEGSDVVLAGGRWVFPGELAFYCAGHPTVYNFGPLCGDRYCQYDLWRPNPLADAELFRGKTFLIVGNAEMPLDQTFERVDPPREVTHKVGDQILHTWTIQVARGFKGSVILPERSY